MPRREGLRASATRLVEDFFTADEEVPVLLGRLEGMGGVTFCREFKFLTGRAGTHHPGSSLLHRAAWMDSTIHMQALLQMGVPVDARDSRGLAPIHLLCGACAEEELFPPPPTEETRERMFAKLMLLVQAGADRNVRCDFGFGLGRPIEQAMGAVDMGYSRFESMMEGLVILGADCATKDDDGNSMLFLAASADLVELLHLLLDAKGLDIDHRNQYGETALFVATPKTFKCLLARGADMTIKNNAKEPPLLRMYNRPFEGSIEVWAREVQQCEEIWARELQRRWPTTTACSKLPLPLINALTRVFYCVAGR